MHPSTILVQSQRADARGFRALGDPARLAILAALLEGTRCVCELVPQLEMAQNLLSYHMRILRDAGLVRGSRRGRRIEYTIEGRALVDLQRSLVGLLPDRARGARSGGEGVEP